ncbi:hypothetical protein ILYODFUR_038486, partial [Ilyodon furcidens]
MLSCRRIWDQIKTCLQRTAAQNMKYADKKRRLAPTYSPGQEDDSIISPTTIRLRLPSHYRVHPIFHVFLKPYRGERETDSFQKLKRWINEDFHGMFIQDINNLSETKQL